MSSSQSARVKTAKNCEHSLKKKTLVHQQSRFFLSLLAGVCVASIFTAQPTPYSVIYTSEGNWRCCILCRKRKGVSGEIKGMHGRFYSPCFISPPLQRVLLRCNILHRSTEQTSTAPHVKENFCQFLKALRCAFFFSSLFWSRSAITEKFSLIAQQHMSDVLLRVAHTVFLLRE